MVLSRVYRILRRVKTTQMIALGFAVIIGVGSLLLTLPMASRSGQSVGYLTALFTATSATCVTGLVVVDTGEAFSVFGQIVIIALIQVGGLGFMAVTTLFLTAMHKRISFRQRMLMAESISSDGFQGLVGTMRNIVFMALGIEAVGAIILAVRFVPQYGPAGLWYGAFHSISAFCNAGFDIFGLNSSLIPFRQDAAVNLPVMLLIIMGGLGFTVLSEIRHKRSFKKLSLHAKLAVGMSALLVAFGFLFFLFTERNTTQAGFHWYERILPSLFQSVTLRTAGFVTVDQNELTTSSKIMSSVMMFVGASPASTGGGIKTTTFGIVLLMLLCSVRGRDEITAFGRSITFSNVQRALSVFLLSIVIIVVFVMLLSYTERETVLHTTMGFQNLLFEAVSAFGTVGVSCNLTPALTPHGRLLIIALMFIGRVGPMTLAYAVSARQSRVGNKIHHPPERVIVG